jgi:hypothetical protein
VYVGLYGWVSGTKGDFRVNQSATQADVGATFDAVTYLSQSGPNAKNQLCAVVALAMPGAVQQTICPGDVVKLR